MMLSVETWLRQGQRTVGHWLRKSGFRKGLLVVSLGAGGFFLSASALRGAALPLGMGLICAFPGWQGAVIALGSALGYPVFWGAAGLPGLGWTAGGLGLGLLFRKEGEAPLRRALRCAMGAFWVSVVGLVAQLLGQDVPITVYLLQIVVGAAGCGLFPYARLHRDALVDWILGGVGTFALAGVGPLGYGLGAMLAVSGAFPAAALAGLGLDLARVTGLPMAVVLCLSYFARLCPGRNKLLRYGAPGAVCLGVMALLGEWDLSPLPGLILGGAAGLLLPARPELRHRRGETGLAQVRLEISAGILAQTQQLLLEAPLAPMDENALLTRAIEAACGSCSARNSCVEKQRLSLKLLAQPEAFQCRKPGRIQPELRRAREQWKLMTAQRRKLEQYRWALIQQYQFLSDHLRSLADQLPRRGDRIRARFRLQVCARSTAREQANGDACLAFSGPGCLYYVLLCDGMGTGLGAAEEADSTCRLLKKMLIAGFPPEHALRSINSLLALSDRSGAVTMDLAALGLDTGRVTLYKWGAAASYVLRKSGVEKTGTAGPPPGLSVTDGREEVIRLSLKRGDSLILLSDGAALGEGLRRDLTPEIPPGELAARLLEGASGEDDATAVVIRLHPEGSPLS